MIERTNALRVSLLAACLFALAVLAGAEALTGLTGRVTDPSDASVPGAKVVVSSGGKPIRAATTDATGAYSLPGLPAGSYTIRVAAPGFAVFEVQDYPVGAGAVTKLDAQLTVALEKQEVTVNETDTSRVSVDPSSNVGALVLNGTDLDALSDDPDDLQADLQALAGPSVGPNGGEIFIDGFSGGQLPPKASIREVRVNSNPFSAEYDRLGFGRIEILTKPGTDKFRGQAMFMFGDDFLNARSPFTPSRAPFQSRMPSINLSGPLSKKASFNFEIEQRSIDEAEVYNAQCLDTSLLRTSCQGSVSTPLTRWNITPRIDYAINANNTLVVRYSLGRNSSENQGAGNYALPLSSLLYDTSARNHTVQVTETSILSAHAVNETRLQYRHSTSLSDANNSTPTLNVSQAFTAGGSQVGRATSADRSWELQNLTSLSRTKHTIKFGGRLRTSSDDSYSPANFGGTFTFTGGNAAVLDANLQPMIGANGLPVMDVFDSLEIYRRTLLLQQRGITGSALTALGYGASQFSIAGGNPAISISQMDVGLFLTDDWRLRQNFTLSLGLRYETQNNINDHGDIAPRIGFAWAVDGGKNRQAKTVVRGGAGIFYDRISDSLISQGLLFNGVREQQYVVRYPDFFPIVPSLDTLQANLQPQTIRQVQGIIRAPYIAQGALSVERQLPKNTTASVTYAISRGLRMLRTRNINAPYPEAGLPVSSWPRPFGEAAGDIELFESSGSMRQQQLIMNVNTRFSRRVSLFGFYSLNKAESNTDGVGSNPANSYDLSTEWGPARYDVRHRAMIGGMIRTIGGLTWSPFIIASSGMPFNITTGYDVNGDQIFADRPSFAVADPSNPNIKVTPFGTFNARPAIGDAVIPRNYGRGPGQFTVNLRLSRTWSFGNRASARPNDPMGGFGGPGGPRGDGPRGGGMGPGGMGPGGLGGMRGMMRGGGDTNPEKRFNLTLSVSARNLLNHVNLAAPNGSLTSPFFGESTALAGGFGGGAAFNRRLDLQLRLSF